MKELTFWTEFMAIAIAISAIIALVTLIKINIRQKFELANLLYKEFTNVNLNIWKIFNILSLKKYESIDEMRGELGTEKFDFIDQNKMDLIIFFTKLGLLIRKRILNFEYIDVSFNNFLVNEDKINNTFNNLKLIFENKPIPYYLYRNVGYLFSYASKKYNIKSYKKIINYFVMSYDLTKIEISRFKRFLKKIKFWDKDYFREFGN